jgi:formamidopyrimidine-DNA glycosylase
MPELPEVETVRRGLEPHMVGARIETAEVTRAGLRYPFPEDFAARLAGRGIVSLGRRSKYLLAELDDDSLWLSHLGMTGSFRVGDATPGAFALPRGKDAAHDHVRLVLSNGDAVVYNDPRRFGFMDLFPLAEAETHPRLLGLGPEPLSNAFSPAVLLEALAGRAAPIKAVLLDQRTVAGLGNIYVAEALWRAAISPEAEARTVAAEPARVALLHAAIREVLEAAIAAGGSTLRDHRQADGSLGYFQHTFAVYGRDGEPCGRPGCGGTVTRIRQSGRSTFFCELCQR